MSSTQPHCYSISKTTATLLALTIVFLNLAACARLGARSSTTHAAGNPWTIHGVLRMVDTRQPDNLNPLLSFGQVATDLSMFWAAYLFRYNDRNELVPELALEIPTQSNGGISKDGRTITYHLRKGVRWQDGAVFRRGRRLHVATGDEPAQQRAGQDGLRLGILHRASQ